VNPTTEPAPIRYKRPLQDIADQSWAEKSAQLPGEPAADQQSRAATNELHARQGDRRRESLLAPGDERAGGPEKCRSQQQNEHQRIDRGRLARILRPCNQRDAGEAGQQSGKCQHLDARIGRRECAQHHDPERDRRQHDGGRLPEDDRLGGNDPYSNSKACAEFVTHSYRHSFFNAQGAARVATARAGNVFGGGDWARDRLVPDAMQAFLASEALRIRNPNSVRPWQHALDPLLGYLTLVERLADDQRFTGGWNFGPDAASEVPVRTVVDHLIALWGGGARWTADSSPHPHEGAYLRLDCAKSRNELGWAPRLDLAQGLRLTVDWYKAVARGP